MNVFEQFLKNFLFINFYFPGLSGRNRKLAVRTPFVRKDLVLVSKLFLLSYSITLSKSILFRVYNIELSRVLVLSLRKYVKLKNAS